ncbi:site-specific integrase [Mycolicibacterium septicum]|uniref:tyrosine-type recombinase/integrase n=1 Tax=Mycolicibacterium septicum TaxID=98668 RepID=UPI0023E09B13|nr:site-specific integrase [Mycolicibacterium septicum]MDF3342104.1 site-specific integrase [Mycolicibacterium septicum]
MGTRRADGEGSYRQRPNGLWEAATRYTTPGGQRKRLSVYGKTRAEARGKLNDARKRLAEGAPPRDDKQTVGTWLATWRTTALPASSRKATTQELYAGLCRKHLEGDANLAGLPLDQIRPTHIEALVLRLRGKGLSDSTVRQVYTVLRAALDIAVRDGLLAANPAAKVKRPAVAPREARYLSTDDVRRLLSHLDGLRYRLAVLVLATTGMRRGEVAGLRWFDVDLDKGELTVAGIVVRVAGALTWTAPKADRSRRRIPLTAGLVTELKAHRKKQVVERLHAGDQWLETGAIFATEAGGWVDPRNLLRTVEIAGAKAGIEDVGAHTLRHSAAVGWLESGVHIKAAADLLGHASISITGDLYGHTSDDAARAAVKGLGDALGM